ncbi:hypothetical protein G6F57_022176 [Rhizopus arrhizus]|nr:hypothetical protein G6F27_014209 [Rhizopus arrhizus]KAG1317349.1 hypothetical protein G6F63_015706 [Rhizopus arrhizus]KAG1433401.1 hypothetical protein G6F57_022176 [Rhizopus arrhizus]
MLLSLLLVLLLGCEGIVKTSFKASYSPLPRFSFALVVLFFGWIPSCTCLPPVQTGLVLSDGAWVGSQASLLPVPVVLAILLARISWSVPWFLLLSGAAYLFHRLVMWVTT